jgi:hypothetical protein
MKSVDGTTWVGAGGFAAVSIVRFFNEYSAAIIAALTIIHLSISIVKNLRNKKQK